MFKVFLQPGDMLRCACFLGNFLPQWTYSLYVKKKNADIKANLFYGEKYNVILERVWYLHENPMYISVLNMIKVYKL